MGLNLKHARPALYHMTYIFSPLYSLKLSLTKLPRLALKRLQIGMMYSDSKRISKKRTSEVEVFSLFHLSNRSDHGVLSFSFPRSSPEVWGVRGAQLEFCGSQSRERISSQVCTDLITTGFMSYLFREEKRQCTKVSAGLSGGD